MTGTNRYIGSPVERTEDLRFLRGRGEFVGDLWREGLLHAAILRSPVAHGRIRGIDATPALELAGVRAVITAAEIGAVPMIPLRLLPLPGTDRFLQPVIAADRVRYVGEPIAVVVADSAALAEDGVGAIALDIEELPPVINRQASGQRDVLLFDGSRHQPRDELHRDLRRCRRGVPRSRLRSPRAIPGAASHGDDHGAARHAGGMGRGARAG